MLAVRTGHSARWAVALLLLAATVVAPTPADAAPAQVNAAAPLEAVDEASAALLAYRTR